MNLSKYENIIWDWNGTLLSDVDYCVGCMNQLLKERELPAITKKKYKEVFTFPVEEYYVKLGFDFSKESFDIVGHKFMDLYFENLSDCQLYPQVNKILKLLEQQEKNQFIVSAMEHQSLMEVLQEKNILKHFNGVYGIDNHLAAGKLDRAKQMISEHHVNLDKTVLIGDSIHDKEVADALGCNVILIANGHQSKNRLKKESKIVLDNLYELMSIV